MRRLHVCVYVYYHLCKCSPVLPYSRRPGRSARCDPFCWGIWMLTLYWHVILSKLRSPWSPKRRRCSFENAGLMPSVLMSAAQINPQMNGANECDQTNLQRLLGQEWALGASLLSNLVKNDYLCNTAVSYTAVCPHQWKRRLNYVLAYHICLVFIFYILRSKHFLNKNTMQWFANPYA